MFYVAKARFVFVDFKGHLVENYSQWFLILDTIYTSESFGSDESGDGSEAKPFKTVLQVSDICNEFIEVNI